jgi:hypothetical protein
MSAPRMMYSVEFPAVTPVTDIPATDPNKVFGAAVDMMLKKFRPMFA